MAMELAFNALKVFLWQFAALHVHHLNTVIFWIACKRQLSSITDAKRDIDCSVDKCPAVSRLVFGG